MANDLVTQGRRDVAVAGNPWADAARDIETGTYLKFNGNDGRYSYGQDDEDLPVGSRVVGDMDSMAFGWTCWVESAVEEEVYVSVHDGRPPMEHDLPDHGPYNDDDGWRESGKISLVLESYGDDDQDEAVGTPLLWKSSTGGQVRQIKKLAQSYGRVFSQHPGEYPIIELGAESYTPKVKKHGKIKWSPVLKIVGWMTEEELQGLTGAPADDREEPEPKASRSRRDEPEDEPPARGRGRRQEADDEQEEAPARGRGRRAEPEDEPEERPARGRRTAPAEDDVQDEAPARGRGRRAEPEDEPEERPARGRGRRQETDDGDDEAQAPAPRGRSRGRDADGDDDEGDEAQAPAPRGRSAGRGENRRLRQFD